MSAYLEVSKLPPVPWVRERDIDLLLAELLATEPEFVAWLIGREMRHHATAPKGSPHSVHAVVNYARPDAPAASAGETDVLVCARYPGGELVLSIENKVWATTQPMQGQRHRRFVESQDTTWRLAGLVAPRAWLDSHPAEVAEYHFAVALEDVAAWCTRHSFSFRAAVFEQGCRPAEFDLAPDLQDWHAAADRILSDELGLRLVPQRYVRTKSAGQAKSNRWPTCDTGMLRPAAGGKQPYIVLKPASARHGCRASLELPKAPPAILNAVRASAPPDGLAVRVTAAGTLIVDRHVPEADPWTMASDVSEQIPHLLAVGRAALALQQWWNALMQQSGTA